MVLLANSNLIVHQVGPASGAIVLGRDGFQHEVRHPVEIRKVTPLREPKKHSQNRSETTGIRRVQRACGRIEADCEANKARRMQALK